MRNHRMICRRSDGSFHMCPRAWRRNVHFLTHIRHTGLAHDPSKSQLERRHQLDRPPWYHHQLCCLRVQLAQRFRDRHNMGKASAPAD